MKGGLGNLMKQAQQMQADLQKAQAELANMEVTGVSGGGMVRVTMTGRHDVRRVEIDDTLIGEDKEMLEDLIVAAVNDAPTVAGAAGTLAYTEGGGAQVIDATLTVADVETANIASATITLSAGFVSAEDVLAFVDAGSITGSYNAATGVLTLTGSDTLANYEAALESITYTNTNTDNPNTGNRTVTWVVNDGSLNSAGVTSTITVAGVNDAPTVAGAAGTLAYTEGDGPLVIDAALAITDVDDTNIESATVSITAGFVTTEDVLAFTNTANITGVYVPATGILTLTGTDTLANYELALESITYENTNVANPATAARTVTWVVNDGNDNSAGVTSTITMTPVNDAPAVAGAGEVEGDALAVGHAHAQLGVLRLEPLVPGQRR